jgi:hypothetical protein
MSRSRCSGTLSITPLDLGYPAKPLGPAGIQDLGKFKFELTLDDTPGSLGIQDCADPKYNEFHLVPKAERERYAEWFDKFQKESLVMVDGSYDTPGTYWSKGKHIFGKKGNKKSKGFYSYGGYAKYGGDKLSLVLKQLQSQGKLGDLQLSEADLGTIQGMAEAETKGFVNGINTWDNMVLSWGFKQWTLGADELQDVIKRAPEAFKRYGIELDPSHTFRVRKNKVRAISGVSDPQELREANWVIRFYRAGLDPDILKAEVEKALEQERKLEKKAKLYWSPYLDKGKGRRIISEVDNNRPAYVNEILKRTHDEAAPLGAGITEEQYLKVLKKKVPEVYQAKENDQSKGERLVTHALKGT